MWTRKRDDDNDCRVFRTIVKTWGTTKAKQKVETRSGARGKSRERQRDCVLDFRETFLIVHVEPRVPPFPSSWVDLAKEECHVLNLNGNYFQRIHLMAHCLRPRRKREREKEEENECNDGLSEFTRGVTRFSIRWSVKPTHPRMLARNQKNILSRERYKITIEHI